MGRTLRSWETRFVKEEYSKDSWPGMTLWMGPPGIESPLETTSAPSKRPRVLVCDMRSSHGC